MSTVVLGGIDRMGSVGCGRSTPFTLSVLKTMLAPVVIGARLSTGQLVLPKFPRALLEQTKMDAGVPTSWVNGVLIRATRRRPDTGILIGWGH
jgi:hypothetical protein